MLVASSTTWSNTTVIWRRTPCRISVIFPVASAFFKRPLTAKTMAGREGGTTASSGRRVAIVLARMPFTRHDGHFRGLGAFRRGGGAVVKSDLETILRSVALGAPGSSLDTCSNRVTAFWMCRLDCLAVGMAEAFLGTLGWGADVAAAAYVAGFSRSPEPERSQRLEAAACRRSWSRSLCPWCWAR